MVSFDLSEFDADGEYDEEAPEEGVDAVDSAEDDEPDGSDDDDDDDSTTTDDDELGRRR